MPPDITLGERELEIMTVLWANGSGTVTEVREALSVELAYTTVLTILRNLETKGYLTRKEEGRGHRYSPRVQEGTTQRRALSRVVTDFFHGSASALVAQLVDTHKISPEELKELAATLQKAKKDAPKRSNA